MVALKTGIELQLIIDGPGGDAVGRRRRIDADHEGYISSYDRGLVGRQVREDTETVRRVRGKGYGVRVLITPAALLTAAA